MTRAERLAALLEQLVADGRIGFARICELTEVSGVLTDGGADPAVLEAIRATGVEVLIA